MKNNKSIIAVIALLAIIVISIYAYKVNSDNNTDDMSNNSSQQSTNMGSVDKTSSEYIMYNSLTGRNYDQMFLANMIAHHQGAVDMANLALTNAKHQEIKDMANNIISAQTTEIKNMETWQEEWGYPSSSGVMMEDHSSMGMMDSMASMTASLEGLSGDEFDKAFLSSMIEHHQSAINMSYPGQFNAEHEEVKELTKAIVNAQSSEITQMQQWQKDWQY